MVVVEKWLSIRLRHNCNPRDIYARSPHRNQNPLDINTALVRISKLFVPTKVPWVYYITSGFYIPIHFSFLIFKFSQKLFRDARGLCFRDIVVRFGLYTFKEKWLLIWLIIAASGLLYASELIEEHSRLAKMIGQRSVYVCIWPIFIKQNWMLVNLDNCDTSRSILLYRPLTFTADNILHHLPPCLPSKLL